MEQLLSEEKDVVKETIEGYSASHEGEQERQTDVMIEKSELEKELFEDRKKLYKDEIKPKVECLCVHGTCKEGESECSGRCDSGWTGRYCDVPDAGEEKMMHINRRQKRDYTSDGLYKPQ